MSNENDGEATTVQLPKESEWRFEVEVDSSIKVKLTTGTAELFGVELVIGPVYIFSSQKSAIFTWTGCTLEIQGPPSSEYIANETPMHVYANLHFALEKERINCSSVDGVGPRVLILGPEHAGKTSLTKILASYAVKQQHSPMIVNLDPKEARLHRIQANMKGLLSLPGTISATTFSDMMDAELGFGTSTASGPSGIPSSNPIVYYYGSESVMDNFAYYSKLVARAALTVTSCMASNREANTAGCIIDTAGLIDRTNGYELVQNIISDFGVTILIILGNERLYSDMVRKYDGKQKIRVIKVPKSGGCVEKDSAFVTALQQMAIRRYFYGEPRRVLSPHNVTVDFSQLIVYRIGENSLAHASALPIGFEEGVSPTQMVKVEPSAILQNMILAVSHVNIDELPESLLEASVMGFIHIREIQGQNTNATSRPTTTKSPPDGQL